MSSLHGQAKQSFTVFTRTAANILQISRDAMQGGGITEQCGGFSICDATSNTAIKLDQGN